MRYLTVRPAMTLTIEDLDRLLAPEEELPPTERRPDLTKAWAAHMNDVIEVNNRPSKPLTVTSG